MAIGQGVEENFDQVVPGAAGKRDAFLGEIRKQCNDAGLGVVLSPVQPKKRDDRYVLRGTFTVGSGLKKKQYTLEVYADPIGMMLQTGWQLATMELTGVLANTAYGASVRDRQARISANPAVLRELNGILQAFHQGVFLPTLQLLSEAVGGNKNSQGFLGA